jgi:hypothetical protein
MGSVPVRAANSFAPASQDAFSAHLAKQRRQAASLAATEAD